MAIDSKRKGKNGELEMCHTLRTLFGWSAHRTQQRTGWSDGNSPDIEVEETPDIFWEVKRVQRLQLEQAMSLATEQCGRRCPVVAHRKNGGDWLITLRLADLPRLSHAFSQAER